MTRSPSSACAAFLLVCTLGCATLREVAALRDVDFRISGVSNVNLAGVDLSRVQTYEDLNLVDVGRLTSALVQKRMPLQFDLQLQAENPAGNSVNARLLQMDWVLLLQEKETIRGTFDRAIVLPPGEPREVPIAIRLDLLEFFEGQARDLVEVALAVSGRSANSTTLALQAVPTIDTALGPIRYPQPITIVRKEFGG